MIQIILLIDSLFKAINELLDKHIPLKKMSKKQYKQQFKPWITSGICKSISIRDKLLKQYINCKVNTYKTTIHINYKQYRNSIVKLIRQSKKNYYQKYFSENSQNIKKTWEGIKTIISISKIKSMVPDSLNINNKINNDPTDIANCFNEYFTTIGSKLQSKIISTNKLFSQYLKNTNPNSFFINPTTANEISNLISSLNENKANGPFSIPSKIFKLIKNNVSEPLCEIINLSFSTGIYPDNLKIAKILPVYKNKGSNLECNNYRPISLLSNINKIFEKLMHSRLFNFLNLHNCIYNLQFGFREKHSTDHALFSITEKIRETLDDNNFVCGTFIDLQKAFDTVDHSILLKKLENYGVRGLSNQWFESYLNNRKQYVSINGFDSMVQDISIGVPQGSVLGPLLFLIYINDLSNAIKYSTVHHFADDTNLLTSSNKLKSIRKQLNLDLRFLCNWLTANKISLNASKTVVILFKHPNKTTNYDLKLKINGQKIILSESVKYLGIDLDKHLNWQQHTANLKIKLSRSIGMLSKIRHYVSSNILTNIYYAIFSSHLTYGCQIWGQNKNSHINRIICLQNKALKIMHFRSNNNSSLYLFYFIFLFRTYLTCLACKSSGIYPVDCFQQGARTSRFGAKPPAPQFYKVATTSR